MARLPEAPRDLDESAFTPILRQVWEAAECVLAAAFVDHQGECIDYCSSLDPYDVKVCAAHMLVLMDALEHSRDALGGGKPTGLEIVAAQQELWVLRLSDEYLMVVALQLEGDHGAVRRCMDAAVRRFRREVGIPIPAWELAATIEVTLRPAVGWAYAPATYVEGDETTLISEVLGRWLEAPLGVGGEDLVCFRVRTERERELTLVHDPDSDDWMIRV